MAAKLRTKTLFVIAACLIALDQATKLAAKGFSFLGIECDGIGYREVIPVIGNFVTFVLVENEGMAFGISFGVWKIFLSLFSIVASVALAWYITKIERFDAAVRVGVTLIFSGASGNLIDRVFYGVIFGESPLFYGRVVDFIQFDIPDVAFLGLHYTHFPVFNVADSCVTIGVCLLLLFHNRIPSFDEVFNRKTDEEAEFESQIEESLENDSDQKEKPGQIKPGS